VGPLRLLVEGLVLPPGWAAVLQLIPADRCGRAQPAKFALLFALPLGPEDNEAVAADGSEAEPPQAAPGVSAQWLPGRMQLAVGGSRVIHGEYASSVPDMRVYSATS